jgi:hypothetical protein
MTVTMAETGLGGEATGEDDRSGEAARAQNPERRGHGENLREGIAEAGATGWRVGGKGRDASPGLRKTLAHARPLSKNRPFSAATRHQRRHHAVSKGFHPGLLARTPFPQKAPGGSRGTPGGMTSRLPCVSGLNRGINGRRVAWITGRLSYPVSPGFHPGLLARKPAHKKPPAEAGGLRVTHLPACHAMQVRTVVSLAVVWHG